MCNSCTDSAGNFEKELLDELRGLQREMQEFIQDHGTVLVETANIHNHIVDIGERVACHVGDTFSALRFSAKDQGLV